MRLLLVEDDAKIAEFVCQGLKEAGFAVDHMRNGEDGLHMALKDVTHTLWSIVHKYFFYLQLYKNKCFLRMYKNVYLHCLYTNV